MEDDLALLLMEVTEQQALAAMQRRKELAEALEQNPDILNDLVSDLIEDTEADPQPESPESSESHWTSRLHPEWTEDKLVRLDETWLEVLKGAPGLSPADIEELVQIS